MTLGTVAQLWRYPVKSLGGESLQQVEVARHGLAGDRHWAVYDPQAPVIRSAKQWPQLLALHAAYQGEPGAEDRGTAVAPVRLFDAAGESCDSAADCDAWLQARLGHSAQLRPRAPLAERSFYALPGARSEAEIARELGLEEGEALPDFDPGDGDVLAQLASHATPPGFLYDAYPVHLLTTDSLRLLREHGAVDADPRRFRPNLLIEPARPAAALTEQDWLGVTLAIGEVRIRIQSPTLRCSMPARAQPGFGLPADPGLGRLIARLAGRNLGVNVQVLQAGRIRVGDAVERIAG